MEMNPLQNKKISQNKSNIQDLKTSADNITMKMKNKFLELRLLIKPQTIDITCFKLQCIEVL